jgi:very-short-patch-repair endonuclease
LDFYCHPLKLAIEVDGSVHQQEDVKENDAIRQKQLEEAGLSFLRFTNDQIILRLEGVIQQIESYLQRQLETHKDSPT